MTGAQGDDLLEVVRETAEGYEVFGELGRESDEDVWFLARKANDTVLVALRLQQARVDDDGSPVYSLEVARELSSKVSMEQGTCSKCDAQLRSFAKFCSKCGADQSMERTTSSGDAAAEKRAMLESVREAASTHYAVLGEMPWSGAGSVYFALEKSTGLLVRLRLRDSDGGFELKETQVGMTLAGALTASYTSSPVGRGSRPIVRQRSSAPQPAIPSGPPPAAQAPVIRPVVPPPPHPMARSAPPSPPAASDARYRTLLYITIGLGVVVVVLLVLLLVR